VSRTPRSRLPANGAFHAFTRGVDRVDISRDDLDRRTWVALFNRAARRFDWDWRVYCLMPNHFHVVVVGELEALSRGMHYLNGQHAARFNRRHGRTGHLFQGRFGIRVIDGEETVEDVCAYVLENPIRAGLCNRVEDWPWSGQIF
jgi:putative transposase